jgi:hypothetical protein
MKPILAVFAACFLLAGCSAKQQPERSLPQCLSLCSNQFASCTEEFPGDASACLPGRNECQRTCEADRAEKRMEGGSGRSTPDRPVLLTTPDVGPESGEDSGDNAPD